MTPNNAPTKASTRPKPPWYSFHLKVGNNSDTDIQSDSEELAVLIHIRQTAPDNSEFVLCRRVDL